MWDRTLARIDAAAAAAAAGARFGATGAPQPVSRGANLVFRMRTGEGRAYLRLVHAALRTRREVEAAAAYHAHVHAAGAPVAPPLRSAAGRAVEALDVGGEPVLATACAAVPGRPVEAVPEEYAAWGRALGALHAAAASFTTRDPGAFYSAERLWAEAKRDLPGRERHARAQVERLDAWLAGLPRGGGARGLTHADCNRTNALFHAGRVRLIDFDEPAWHWWAADVARPFRELTPEHPAFDACRRALVAGYREVRPLAARWVRALPELVRVKNLEMLAWLARGDRWEGDVLPGGRDRAAVLDAIRRSLEDRPPAR